MLFSEPKIPQSRRAAHNAEEYVCFSALQRAENSSIKRRTLKAARLSGFSALQRAENSSICDAADGQPASGVSVLFSEPKIPQS